MTSPAVAPPAPDEPGDTAAGRPDVQARRSRWLLVGSLLAALAVYLPLLGPSLVGQQVFLETSLVLRLDPWSQQTPVEDQSGFTVATDTIDFYTPRMTQFVDRLRDGDLAQWEPLGAGGSPLAAVPDTAVFSPLSLPYYVLPIEYAPAWVRLLEVVVAIGFTAAFLRRLGLASGPAVLGGLLYSTSGFLVLWNNWPQAQVAALIPSLLWAVERALQLRRPRDAVPIALATAALVLASFPSVVVYTMVLVGPYVLVRTVRWRVRVRELLRTWVVAGAGVVLGAGLVAWQLLPFREQLATLAVSSRQFGPEQHPPVSALLTTVAPYLFGNETMGVYFGYTNAVEAVSYFGVVGVALVLLGLALRVRLPVPRGVTGYFLGALVSIMVVGWYSEAALDLVMDLPTFRMNFIARTRSVLAVCLAVLAALGAEKLVRLPTAHRPYRAWPLAVLGGLAFLGLTGLAFRTALATARGAGQVPVLVDGLVVPGVVFVLLLVLLGLLVVRRGQRLALVALALVPVLVAVEGLAFIAPRWPSEDVSQYYPRTAAHDFLDQRLGAERVAAATVLAPGTTTQYGLRSVTSHSFQANTWRAAIATASPNARQSPTFTNLSDDEDTARSPLLDRLGARYFVGATSTPVIGTQVAPAGGTDLVEMADGREVTAPLVPGARRALLLDLAGFVTGARGRLTATFEDASGAVVGTASRGAITPATPSPLALAVAGEQGPLTTATRVRLRFDGIGARARGAAGVPALGQVLPRDDGLRLALTEGVLVYERRTALPRIRFATSSVSVGGNQPGLQLLDTGTVPDDTVVLQGAGAPGAAATTGPPPTVTVQEDSGEDLAVTASSAGGGWLVVADALQSGWEATVDGEPAPLVQADVAGVGIAMPAGRHEVVLHYAPPGLRTGLLVSAASALLVLVLLLSGPATRLVGRLGRRPRSRHASPPDG